MTFGKDFKRLAQIGNPCLVAGKNILKVPQDYILYTYHLMFFQKIEKKFGLWPTGSEVSTPTPANTLKLGFMVWSTDARTYKIDGFISKNKNGW